MSDNPLLELSEVVDAPISPATGIAALAMNFALKYHDINHIHDGQLYQQYKIEGRNIAPLSLEWVFETARRIELHIMAAPNRLTDVLLEAVVEGVLNAEEERDVGDDPEPIGEAP